MDHKSSSYDNIVAEIIPRSFRITKSESIVDNGMSKKDRAHYEEVSQKTEAEIDEMAKNGDFFGGFVKS